MKKSDLQFGALLVPLDLIMLVAAGIGAYAVRYSRVYAQYVSEATVTISFHDYTRLVVIVAIGWMVIFGIAGLYRLRTYRSIWDEIGKIFLACSTGISAVVIFIFLNRELFASRFIVLAAWVLAVLFVSFGRLVARSIQRKRLQQGKGVHHVVIVGSNAIAQQLADEFASRPGLGFVVLERFMNFEPDKARLLSEMIQSGVAVDEILLADPNISHDQKYRLLDSINEHHVDFRYAADILGWLSNTTSVDTLAGIPLVEVKKTPLEGWGRILKRAFDIVVAALLLLILSPIFLVIAIWIKIDSPGSVFYASKRVGTRNSVFGLLKFRSMVVNAEKLKEQLLAQNERQDGPMFKMKNDPRVTRSGRFIRKWSIDELPQLWNVIRGEVSLVGPRPHEPHEVAQYQKHHKRLLDIKPGVTGMAQVSGRSDLVFEDEVRLDTYYIEHWSLWLDIKIMLQTPRAVLAIRKGE